MSVVVRARHPDLPHHDAMGLSTDAERIAADALLAPLTEIGHAVARGASAGAGTSGSPWTGWEAAVNALPADSHIHFRPGYYSMSTGLVAKAGWVITGHRATVRVASGVTLPGGMISVVDVDDVTIQGSLTLDLNKANTPTGTQYQQLGVNISAGALGAATVKRFRIQPGVRIINGHQYGVFAYGYPAATALEVDIAGAEITDHDGYAGVHVSFASRLSVDGCVVSRNGTAARHGSGIIFDGGSIITIRGNTVEDNYAHGITSSNNATVKFHATNNHCNRNGHPTDDGGWGINSSTRSADFLVSGNICMNNYNGGITVDPQVVPKSTVNLDTPGIVSNNVCAGAVHDHGINTNWVKHLTITGNVCYGNANSGIALLGRYCTVSGNVCHDNGAFGLAVEWETDKTEPQGDHIIGPNMLVNNGAGQLYLLPDSGGQGLTGMVLVTDSTSVTPWAALTLTAGWTNTSGVQGLRARKDGDNTTIEGSIQNTSGGTLTTRICTLPAGQWPVIGIDAAAVYVGPNGDVYPTAPVAAGAYLRINLTFSTL